SSALKQNMDQLQKAPRFLRETLVFPYTHGKDFCTALYESGGYQAISNAFKHPPASTTQILHPEKYIDNEQPIRIEWPDLAVNGKKPTDDNVLGEFGTRILFEKYMDEDTATASAEGWRGDRYIVYDDGKGMVWKTLWQDADHQSAFRDALQRYLAKRFKQSTTDATNPDNIVFSAPAIPAAPASEGHAATTGSPACTGEILTTKTGNGIILIWGDSKELNDSLLEKFKE
ncbi:MAG TPA: hypothetical protein VG733_11785, partial [Chthoniobacteraceae bacterium]|nr:hypothetical protein [Chthoniobacteraceae bacterium]